MASRRFFTYDPYDYYYTSPYPYSYPYYQYQHHPAPSRGVGGFFPAAAEAAPEAVRVAPRPRVELSKPVSIPVHFVGSDPEPEPERGAARMAQPKKREPSAEEAAVKVQAAARGLMARKSVRAVREVEREAEEAAGKIAREAEALRADARARVAVGEALMRLLLRLDAVRGAREYRRRVTKRVLALQDAVDALEPKAAAAMAAEEETEDSGETEAMTAAAEMDVDGEKADGEVDAVEEADKAQDGAELDDDKPEEKVSGDDAEGEWEMVTEEPEPAAAAASELTEALPQEPTPAQESRSTAEAGAVDSALGARKVMEMVAALCERSAQQCAVIGALAERVDALERAVRRVEDAERRRRRGKKLRKEGKGSNHNSRCYSD
ncbi:hypothetical protein BS78_05G144000 [Paspalum vaginatum]|nr:hypothetical protein BS78_05G144000 [Paspalum vaginatum]